MLKSTIADYKINPRQLLLWEPQIFFAKKIALALASSREQSHKKACLRLIL